MTCFGSKARSCGGGCGCLPGDMGWGQQGFKIRLDDTFMVASGDEFAGWKAGYGPECDGDSMCACASDGRGYCGAGSLVGAVLASRVSCVSGYLCDEEIWLPDGVGLPMQESGEPKHHQEPKNPRKRERPKPYNPEECPPGCVDYKRECEQIVVRAQAAYDNEPLGPNLEQRRVQAYNKILAEGNRSGGPCDRCKTCARLYGECPECGQGYKTAPPLRPAPEQWDPFRDWCGSPINGSEWAPEIDLAVKRCCYEHDQCYAQGGSSWDRLECDRRFYDCIVNSGHMLAAPIYYAVVRLMADDAFAYHPPEVIDPLGPW